MISPIQSRKIDACPLLPKSEDYSEHENATVLMIESIARGGKLKYHKKKLILIYSIMRHFAEELRSDGWTVDYYQETPDFQTAINKHLSKHQPERIWSPTGRHTLRRAISKPLGAFAIH